MPQVEPAIILPRSLLLPLLHLSYSLACKCHSGGTRFVQTGAYGAASATLESDIHLEQLRATSCTMWFNVKLPVNG